MKSTLDCIPCIIDHALHVAKMVTDDVDEQYGIVKKVLALVSEVGLTETPPEMARVIHQIIRDATGVQDAYKEVKDLSTEFALKILPLLKDEVKLSDNPFDTLVRFVIAGNIIDFGADKSFQLDTAHRRITETLELPLEHEKVVKLRQCLDNAKNILYILDNCGEAVIDRLLIDEYREKTTVVVRGFPILNDITPGEVDSSGYAGYNVINTGDSTPGVSMRHSSDEFLEVFNNADLVIAKGQGNFETMSDVDRSIIFLLRAKCKVIVNLLDTDMGSLNIIFKNI